MLCALIMAGGKGTRFWPASTEEKPKQFLALSSLNTMIQETVNRILPLIPIEHIFICTSSKYKNICMEQLPQLPEENIIEEPEGRNTAPCIMLSTLYISRIHKNTNIIVLPSDHSIKNNEDFVSTLKLGDDFINSHEKGIITIGIQPTRPDTNYGYIEFDREKDDKSLVFKVKKFVEKPDLEKAQLFYHSKNFLWNAGMFLFNSLYMLNQYSLYAKKIYANLIELPYCSDINYQAILKEKYSQCDSISVDYAIMEKCSDIYVIPSAFDWDDVGSWKALERYLSGDDRNNISNVPCHFKDCSNNIVFSEDKEVYILNSSNIFVINAGGRIIVGNKSDIDSVYKLRDEVR